MGGGIGIMPWVRREFEIKFLPDDMLGKNLIAYGES